MTTTTDVYAVLWAAIRWPLALIVGVAVLWAAVHIARRWGDRDDRIRDYDKDSPVEPIHSGRARQPWPTRQTPLDHDRVNGMPFHIVPALTMADRYPLPEATAPVSPGVAANHTAPAPLPVEAVYRIVPEVAGYGRHDYVNAGGTDSQNSPDENTGALDPRAMRDLLAASRG